MLIIYPLMLGTWEIVAIVQIKELDEEGYKKDEKK